MICNFLKNLIFLGNCFIFLNDDLEFIKYCPICGLECKYINITVGYRTFCSSKCSSNSIEVRLKTRQTCLEKYDCEVASQSEIVKDKIKQTCLDRYSCENVFQVDEYKAKIKNTNLEKYSVDNPMKSKDIVEKSKQTCLERYDKESYSQTDEFKDKFTRVCLSKYGVDNPMKSKDIVEKSKQTCLERYDKESYFQTDEFKEKSKETCLEKYGNEYYLQTDDFKEKSVQTCLDKYGVENPSQSIEIKNKVKITCLTRYCTEYYTQTDAYKDKYKNHEWVKSIQEKRNNTLKQNNTFNTSKIEEQLKQYLDKNNISYIYQYTSEEYPFTRDFYFPENDLYVEIQGSWTHGSHSFSNSDEDKLLIEKWKSKNTKYYSNAINTRTIRDVRKREVAQENNLKYLEIFSCDIDFCIEKIFSYF